MLSTFVWLIAGNIFSVDMNLPGFDQPSNWRQYSGAKIEKTTTGTITFSGPGVATLRFNENPRDSAKMRGYSGLAFRIRGDGGSHRFSIGLNEGLFRFSLDAEGTDWKEIVIAWSDFVNVSHDLSLRLGEYGPDGIPPEGICHLIFGDYWKITHRNEKIKPFRLEIADLRFVKKAEPLDPLKKHPFGQVSAVVEKMKNGKKTLIYCCGDSITAGTQVGEKRYANLLQEKLRRHFKNDLIEVRTLAVGGATVASLREWVRYDFTTTEKPDLVTVMAGYNDRSGGYTTDSYEASMADYVNRINSHAPGAALILFATAPGVADRYEMLDRYAEAMRQLAKKRNLPCFDLNAVFKKIGPEKIYDYFADRAHPNENGHKLIAERLFEFILWQ